jgi:hypothetical protein
VYLSHTCKNPRVNVVNAAQKTWKFFTGKSSQNCQKKNLSKTICGRVFLFWMFTSFRIQLFLLIFSRHFLFTKMAFSNRAVLTPRLNDRNLKSGSLKVKNDVQVPKEWAPHVINLIFPPKVSMAQCSIQFLVAHGTVFNTVFGRSFLQHFFPNLFFYFPWLPDFRLLWAQLVSAKIYDSV